MTRLWRLCLCLVLLVLGFRLLSFTPLPGIWHLENLFVLLVLGAVALLLLRRLLSRGLVFYRLELYILLLLLLPVLSALMARAEFGQPLVYGVLAQRNLWLAGVALLLFEALRRGLVRVTDIKAALLVLAWGSLLAYPVLAGSLDPLSYLNYPGFVNFSERRGGFRFNFNPMFIVFGFLYYGFALLDRGRPRHAVCAAAFLFYLVYWHTGRSLLLALGAAFGLLFLLRQPLEKTLVYLPAAVLLVVATPVLLMVIDPARLSILGGLFGDAFGVLLGRVGADASANIRLDELQLALPFIRRNWLLGSGDLSHQWNGAYTEVLGYFYPSDIGVFGILFMYGVVGLLLLNYQYLLALRGSRLAGCVGERAFVDACSGFALFYFIYSLATGANAFFPADSLCFVAVLYYLGLRRAAVASATTGRPISPGTVPAQHQAGERQTVSQDRQTGQAPGRER